MTNSSTLSASLISTSPLATCLFTGSALGPGTHEEHTIPRALAGRIRSRIVSSDTFNNDCGSRVDPYLIRLYAETICQLAPLMSSEHEPGDLAVEIPGSPHQFVLDSEGCVTIRGLAVLGRDDLGRPNAVMGRDVAQTRKWIQKNVPTGSPPQESYVPATSEPAFFLNRLVLAPVIELAALKSVMLSFDHLLAGDATRRFTRQASLSAVRTFVRQTVATAEFDGADFNRYSLGLQYDKLATLIALRGGVPGVRQDFEHVLVATGNRATRTLDCILWLCGVDPFGFRLTTNWEGDEFTCIAVSGMLRDGVVSGPVWINTPASICKPTMRRSYPSDGNETTMQNAMSEIAAFRADAYRKAVNLVETSDDALLQRRLATIAQLAPNGDHSIGTACRIRLDRLYRSRIRTAIERSAVDAVVNAGIATLGSTATSVIPPTGAMPVIDWRTTLSVYRDMLTDLRQRFGLPGDTFVSATVIGKNAASGGRLDDHPQSL